MNDDSHTTFSALLERARQGDQTARDQLFTIVYDQLRRIARRQRRQRDAQHTLNTTALVHEAYMKLGAAERLGVRDQAHFMAVAATAMRQILIDHARSRRTAKRGGGQASVSIDEIEGALRSGPDFSDDKAAAVLALDSALERLASHSPRQRRVVECRFFAGYSIDETASALGIAPATVKRDWAMAQAWLYRELRDSRSRVPATDASTHRA